MARRSAFLAVLTFAVGALLLAEPGSAQTPNSNYQGCQAFASDTTVVGGQTITVTGTGANPGDTVTAMIGPDTVGTGVADGNGNFSFPGTVLVTPSPDVSTLTVTCGPSGGAASITISAEVPRSGTGPLATTGANTLPLAKLGVALVAAGGLVLAVYRRRSWTRQPAVAG